jgi:hypothetical protein
MTQGQSGFSRICSETEGSDESTNLRIKRSFVDDLSLRSFVGFLFFQLFSNFFPDQWLYI